MRLSVTNKIDRDSYPTLMNKKTDDTYRCFNNDKRCPRIHMQPQLLTSLFPLLTGDRRRLTHKSVISVIASRNDVTSINGSIIDVYSSSS